MRYGPEGRGDDLLHVRDLVRFGAPPALLGIWAQQLDELTEIQEKAVEAGVLDGVTNVLAVGPTSSGKTLIGELAATSTAYRTRRHGIFIVPSRALADEHYANFRSRYGAVLSVVISTGDWTEFDDDIRSGNFGLAVLTYEKLAGLLVDHPQLLERCSAIVVDEVQMLGDGGRGADLEVLLTQILMHEHTPQLIGLSASLDQLNKLDHWLRAKLVITNERPVPLEEGVVAPASGRLLVASGAERDLVPGQADGERCLGSVVSTFVAEGKQVLVFRSSVEKTRTTAELLGQLLPAPGIAPLTLSLLDELEPSENIESLRRTLAGLVAFHSADLTPAERRAVEASFRARETRVLVATTTLAMGVNLPTDVVVISDHKRWSMTRGQWSFREISVADYKNAAGRAGRLGQKTSGQAILIAEQDTEQRQLLDFYCRGEVEPVASQLPARPFDDVVFHVVCAGVAHDHLGLVDFITHTFAYTTFYDTRGGITAVTEGVERAIAICRESGLVREEGDELAPTQAGRIFARAGIPLAAATRLSSLADALVDGPVPKADLIFTVASCDDVFEARPYVEWDRLRGQPVDPRPTLGVDMKALPESSPLLGALRRPGLSELEARVLARTGCLLEWLAGSEELALRRRYRGCPAARVQSMGKTAAWLLEALLQVAGLHGAAESELDAVRAGALEARYGVPADLAPLARIRAPGVGRAALLRLYAGDRGRGLYEPDTLLEADARDFEDLLRPIELERLRAAIVGERGETLRRRHQAHQSRAQQAALDERVINDLYTANGAGLELAVADALRAAGLTVTRITRQPHGEEDLQISHQGGLIVASVTASQDAAKHISWNKAREVLGAGAGMNPINYVCFGRPGFHSLAERRAREIARETGTRRLLLVPIDVLAEGVVRCREGRLDAEALGAVLARSRGLLALGDLPLADAMESESEEP